jgi:hypothetical protein
MPPGVRKRGQFRFKVWFLGGGSVEVYSTENKSHEDFVAHTLLELRQMIANIERYDEKHKERAAALKTL